MAKIDQKLEEDRTIRDAANAVLRADIDILRNSLVPGDIAARLQERGEDLSTKVLDMADRNRGALAVGGAAIATLAALFFARKPISAKLGTLFGPASENGETVMLPPAADDRSPDDQTIQNGQ